MTGFNTPPGKVTSGMRVGKTAMAEIEKIKRELKIKNARLDLYAPCPDHNGKAPGGCLMCEIEKLWTALEWYAERASALAGYMEVQKTDPMLAVITELSLDGGARGGRLLSLYETKPKQGEVK